MSDSAGPPRPTSAGMYDFYLGGDSHSPADRAAAEQLLQLVPQLADGAWANRGFLQRAVRRLAAEYGIRQFLDIGSGLPTRRNTHDVVAEVAPHGRVAYVDIDPVVVARAQGILEGVEGATVIEGDVRKPESILGHPEVARMIDFTEPVGVLLVAVLHFVSDDEDPWALLRQYLDAVPSGSYLVLSHGAISEHLSDEALEIGSKIYASIPTPPTDRSRTEIERFFEGLEIIPPYQGAEPGVVFTGLWGAEDPVEADSDGSRVAYAAVARKP